MQVFKVVCYKAGEWDLANARLVEARDEQEAAERVCDCPLLVFCPVDTRAKSLELGED